MSEGNLRIADLPEEDKPREKALRNGVESLTDSELLAIILSTGLKGKSVLDLSKEIIAGVESRLDRLASMNVIDLANRHNGVGTAKALTLASCIEFGRRCQRAIDSRDAAIEIAGSSSSVYNMMRRQLELLDHEQFWVLHLARNNKVIARDCVSRGGTVQTIVDIKLIMKHALEYLSAGLIFVHNHPSGNLNPSVQDDNLTTRLKEAAAMFDIRVLDHIIITSGGYYSYNDEGKL